MELLIILLVLVSWNTTIKISDEINEKLALKQFLEVYNKGYLVDLETYSKYIDKEAKKTYSKKRIMLSRLIKILPIINIIFITASGLYGIKSIMKDETIKSGLRPMTEEQKKEYKQNKTDQEKVDYLSLMYQNIDSKNRPKFSSNTLKVKKEKLLALAYTYEEVQKLISKAQDNSLIGKTEWANIAIIGIPKLDKEYDKVFFEKEGKEEHSFTPYQEEEAKGKTYLVYPFTDECETVVQPVIDEIIHGRFDNSKKNNEYHPFPYQEEKPKTMHHIIK